MQVCIHEVEHQVYVSIVFGPNHVLQANNVFVSGQFLKENDLTESTLCISCVLEGIEVFLQRNDLFSLLVDGLPHDTVSSLT